MISAANMNSVEISLNFSEDVLHPVYARSGCGDFDIIVVIEKHQTPQIGWHIGEKLARWSVSGKFPVLILRSRVKSHASSEHVNLPKNTIFDFRTITQHNLMEEALHSNVTRSFL